MGLLISVPETRLTCARAAQGMLHNKVLHLPLWSAAE